MMSVTLRTALLSCIVGTEALSLTQVRSHSGDLKMHSMSDASSSVHAQRQGPASSGEKVAWNDGQTGSPLVFSQLGWPFVDWSMCSVPVHSNLAGLGPDSGEESIRFFNVWTSSDGRGIDIVVTANSSYSANLIEKNGLVKANSCFGQVNVDSSSSVDLLFSFYLTGTNTSVAFEKFYFTVYDLDRSNRAIEHATFYSPADELLLNQNTELVQSGDFASGLTLTATTVGHGHDNPKRPDELNELQRSRSAMISYTNAPQVKITFAVDSGLGGRNFIFSGFSNVQDTPAPTPPPTPPTPTQAPTSCTEAGTCSVYEDPHIKVFDSAQISLLSANASTLADYGSGDMWLVRSTDISIQARYLPDPSLPTDNLFVRAVAIGGSFMGGSTLIVGSLDHNITWNGRSILEAQESEFAVPAGTGLVRAKRSQNSHLVEDMTQANAGVDIELPMGLKITVNRLQKHVNLFIEMPPAAGGQDGLCGNFNCNPFDDSLEMILNGRDPQVSPGESLFLDVITGATLEREM